MKLQRQLIIDHSSEDGRYGDCYRTCIAILIGMEAVDVPHFVAAACKAGRDQSYADALASTWLRERGFRLLSIPLQDGPHINAFIDGLTDGMPYILTGASNSYPGVAHCTIAQGGTSVIWCPVDCGPSQIDAWRDADTGQLIWYVDMIVRDVEQTHLFATPARSQ